jgi:hypothetical protein
MGDTITIKPLPSGHVHIRGRGPGNWAQPPRWPCSFKELDESFFPEASREFRYRLHRLLAVTSSGEGEQ